MNEHDLMPRLARKLKVLRLDKSLTLQMLSERANVSKGLLSKIENSRTIPSLPVFLALVNSLEVPLNEFFAGMEFPQGKDFIIIRSSDQLPIQKEERDGFHYRLILSQTVTTSSFEVVLLTVMPGAKSKLTTADGFEIKYILSGSCEYFVGEEKFMLESGDTVYLDASKPHMPVNRGPIPLVMLVVYFLKTR